MSHDLQHKMERVMCINYEGLLDKAIFRPYFY